MVWASLYSVSPVTRGSPSSTKSTSPQHIPLGDDGGRHGGGILLPGVCDEHLPLPGGVLVDLSVLHDLLQLGADALAHQLPLAAAGHGDNGIPVGDGGDGAAALGQVSQN